MPRSRPTGAEQKRSERETVVTLRLPKELHERLKKVSGERGLTAQIRDRLDASLVVEEAGGTLFADLIHAIAYLIFEAAQLYPGDPDLYPIVDFAVRRLLDAFRPDDARDMIQELYVPTTLDLIVKVERILGVALGATGQAAKLTKIKAVNIVPAEGENDAR